VHYEHDGLSLWYGTPDAPAPSDLDVPPHTASLTVGVRPANPTNAVNVLYRVDGGLVRTLPTRELRTDHDRGTQHFRALFPRFAGGEQVDYGAVLSCGGRQVPGPALASRLPSRFRLARAAPPGGAATASGADARSDQSGPMFAPALEHLATITAQLDSAEVIGDTPEGVRLNFYALGGQVRGPRLNGQILARASDHLIVRRDGVGLIQVQATVLTSDGAYLAAEYYGSLEVGEDGYARAKAGNLPAITPLTIAPRFSTADPRYLWVNRLQCIGVGNVLTQVGRLQYDLYAARGMAAPRAGS
jgi:hypothetical protein